MASLSVPDAGSSTFSFTLGQLKDRIRRGLSRDNQDEHNGFWTEDLTTQAIEHALEWCRPVGVRVELDAVAGTAGVSSSSISDTATWMVPARLTRLDGIRVQSSFLGTSMWQDVPLKAIKQSMATDGTAVLTFPYPVAIGSTVCVMGLWQFELPMADSNTVLWSWSDLLVAASCAEMYRLVLHLGMKTDQMDFVAAEQSWRQHATDLKFGIMTTLGFPPPEPEGGPPPKKRKP